MRLVIIATMALTLTGGYSACKKNNEKKNCLQGKVILTRCMGTVVQITSGVYDPSIVTPKWRDTLKMKAGEATIEYENVFQLVNPCNHQLVQGDEIHFMIKEEEEKTCAMCFAADLIAPPQKNAISLCADASDK